MASTPTPTEPSHVMTPGRRQAAGIVSIAALAAAMVVVLLVAAGHGVGLAIGLIDLWGAAAGGW